MRLVVIWLDVEGLVIACHCLIRLAQALERIAKVVVRLGLIWLDVEGFVISCHGLIQLFRCF